MVFELLFGLLDPDPAAKAGSGRQVEVDVPQGLSLFQLDPVRPVQAQLVPIVDLDEPPVPGREQHAQGVVPRGQSLEQEVSRPIGPGSGRSKTPRHGRLRNHLDFLQGLLVPQRHHPPADPAFLHEGEVDIGQGETRLDVKRNGRFPMELLGVELAQPARLLAAGPVFPFGGACRKQVGARREAGQAVSSQ